MKSVLIKSKPELLVSDKGKSYDLNNIKFFHLCVWVFVIGCLLGYFVEVVYAYAKHGYYINKQGMIYGPFNQVYGMGALVFTLCLYKFRECKSYIIFLAGAVIGGAFEFVCSYLQEIIFKSASWHYTKFPLSLNGRTNLIHSIFWGILGVLFLSFMLPAFAHAVEKVPLLIKSTATWVIFVFMILNLTISACAVYRQSQRLEGHIAKNHVETFLDSHYNDATMKKVYPNMKFLHDNKN